MSDLQTIVRMNEKVKLIVGLSDSVFIVALNAMFQARRAKALGFNTVTSELRKFSAEVAQAMQGLKNSIEYQIEFITRHQHKQHFLQLVDRIKDESSSERSLHFVKKMQRSLEYSTDDMYERFSECYREFNQSFEKAQRACETGHSLFIHAKVEAQSAGVFVQQLLPVVEQIEKSVISLTELLGQIRALNNELSFISSSHQKRSAA